MLVVDAVRRRDTYFQPSNMVWDFLSEQQPCNICQILDSLQWCSSQCLLSIIGHFEGDDLGMVCPTMIDIGIDFISIIRLSLEIITSNEHIMDGANDLAVIKFKA